MSICSPSNANQYITHFAYLGIAGGAQVYLVLMGFCAITDKQECNKFKGMNFIRVIMIFIVFSMLCLIATSLYIDFNPVGNTTINGCQPRYIIPLLAPLLLTVVNPGIKLFRNKSVYNILIVFILSVMGMYTVYTAVAAPMM